MAEKIRKAKNMTTLLLGVILSFITGMLVWSLFISNTIVGFGLEAVIGGVIVMFNLYMIRWDIEYFLTMNNLEW